MSKKVVNIKTNAGIKDILGRGLIHDDNIAIIELIKNSRDANSKDAKIEFFNESIKKSDLLPDDSMITISDSGSGMNIQDIENKWLNIAYSEKKNAKNNNVYYAGNKGVGRFSCDRLGKELVLYTKEESGPYIKLHIDWTLFEDKGVNDDVSSIDLNLEELSKEKFLKELSLKDFSTGTVLKIKKLRSSWTPPKLKKLLADLEKFSPAIDNGFTLYVSSNTVYKDEVLKKKLNGKLNNNILEKLSFKTTYIKSKIDKTGKYIDTVLFFQGNELYSYKAKNPYNSLKNIDVEIHYLDTLSKKYFTETFGVQPNEYGSIFLYHNNYRVSPYGSEKNDWLSLNERKSQGTARYFGTREVFGKVTIEDNDDTFSILSSREGFAQNSAFLELASQDREDGEGRKNRLSKGFVPTIILQLEAFVVQGLDWNRLLNKLDPESKKVISYDDVIKNPQNYKARPIDFKKVEDSCNKILKSQLELEDFKINSHLIKNIQKQADEKYRSFVTDFVKSIENKSFEDLSARQKGTTAKIIRAAQENERLAKEQVKKVEKKVEDAQKKISSQSKELKEFREENLFLTRDVNTDKDDLLNLHHQIVLYASRIDTKLTNFRNDLNKTDIIPKEMALEYIEAISDNVKKISKVSDYASNQKYKAATDNTHGNLIQFISDYIDNLEENRLLSRGISVVNTLDPKGLIKKRFSPLDIMILVDNLISNAKRSNARHIEFKTDNTSKYLFTVCDDGDGLDPSIQDPQVVFKKGFTTTKGSGRGLFHISTTLKKMKLNVDIKNREKEKGAVLGVYE